MVENKSSLFGIIAIIIGASGLGLGAFSFVNFQVVEGPQGKDAPGGIIVGLIDPDQGETITGEVMIRAIIYGSDQYTVSVLRNGTEIGTTLPLLWNTTLESDGWYNITVVATDVVSNNVSRDEVIVFVDSTPFTGQVIQVVSNSTSVVDTGDYATPHTYLSLNINTSKNSSIYISCSTNMRVMFGSGNAYVRLWLDNSIEVSVIAIHSDPSLNLHLPTTITGFYEGLSEGDHTIEFQGWIPGTSEDLYFNWGSDATLTVMEIGA
ncbi:MAG: hypothetical protein ACXACX_21810 [Candidatus Hodarchaeales archaeon]|jgi:hypothetical protein